MTSETLADSGTRELLKEAAEWRLAGLLLERPREGWWQQVEGLAREVDDGGLRAAVEAARQEAREGTYLAVLGPGGAVSPREVGHRPMGDPGRILADITAFYQAFAFRPATEEAPDHVAVEAGFFGYLKLKEAYARACGDGEHAAVTATAAAQFLEAHLSTLAGSLARGLEPAGIRWLSLAARALLQRAGQPKEEPAPRSTSLSSDDCSVTCPVQPWEVEG